MDSLFRIPKVLVVAALTLAAFFGLSVSIQAEDKPVFSKVTVDLGIVVSDLDKAAKFYSEVIGLTDKDATIGVRSPHRATELRSPVAVKLIFRT